MPEKPIQELIALTKEKGERKYHGVGCLYNNHQAIAYDYGVISLVFWENSDTVLKRIGQTILYATRVTVCFRNGERFSWENKWIGGYTSQFGIAVSQDGNYLFVQTWEMGLFCLDPRTGKTIWRSKSRRGITHVFVNEDTILVHQRERALQLLDIHTGELLMEKRPATDWGFASIDHRHIVCAVTARRWELIDGKTLEVKAAFTNKEFTGDHGDYTVYPIYLEGNTLVVRGFCNQWDDSVHTPKSLPNLTFENRLDVSHIL